MTKNINVFNFAISDKEIIKFKSIQKKPVDVNLKRIAAGSDFPKAAD